MIRIFLAVCCLLIGVQSKTLSEIKNRELVNAPDIDWWQTAVFYQIYPRSFKDSDNDGIGDLQGILDKMDHFVDMGVQAIWLSPIYKSPQVDGGYDISDYRDIDPDYGTLDVLGKLLLTAHNNGIKVIMDLVPNHSSDKHEWFEKSVAKEKGYEDYYVWVDGKKGESGQMEPPNNWISVFGNSAWEWNEKRQQYYLHQFTVQQPDLNFRSEKVVQEIKDVMTYWLDLGVDGFRVDAVPHLVEDKDLTDEPLDPDADVPATNWNSLIHNRTKDQPETFEIVYQWREHLDNYTKVVGGDTRMFMTEAATDIEYLVRYYGSGDRLGAHFTFNFFFLGLSESSRPKDIQGILETWNTSLPTKYTKNWLNGNHDNPRVASRVGTKNIDAYNMLVLFLDGVGITYMGEEIGQENGEVTCEEGRDPSAISNCTTFPQVSRDFERTPYQWDDSTNAGFNDGSKPWLPVSKKYNQTNLKRQKKEKRSHYKNYVATIGLRRLMSGYDRLETRESSWNEDVLFLTRYKNTASDMTHPTFVWNMGDEEQTVNILNSDIEIYIVAVSSVGSSYAPGDRVEDPQNLSLQPGESLILWLS